MLERAIALLVVAKVAVALLVMSGGVSPLTPEVRHAAAEQDAARMPTPAERAASGAEESPADEASHVAGQAGGVSGAEMEGDTPQSFEAQVNLLLQIEQKRAALRAEEEALAHRAHWLLQVKADIERRLAELEKLRAELKALVDQRQAEEDRKLLHLVKVYESMRPEQAAPLIDGLDDELVVQIFSRMREKQAAKILEYVDPARGVSISRQIAPRQGQ